MSSGIYYVFTEYKHNDNVSVLSCCKTSFAHVSLAKSILESKNHAFIEFPCFFLQSDELIYDEITPSVKKITTKELVNTPTAYLGISFQ
jgi:hypothetical protein